MCAQKVECRRFCLFYKVTCKCCGNFYVVNTQNTLKIIKPHFQYVSQKSISYKNSDSFSAQFTKYFIQKPSLQKCYKMMSFD